MSDEHPLEGILSSKPRKQGKGSKSTRFTSTLPMKQKKILEYEGSLSGLSAAEMVRLIIHNWVRDNYKEEWRDL